MHRGKTSHTKQNRRKLVIRQEPSRKSFFSFGCRPFRAKEHMPMSIVWTPNEATRHTVCPLHQIKEKEKKKRLRKKKHSQTRNSTTVVGNLAEEKNAVPHGMGSQAEEAGKRSRTKHKIERRRQKHKMNAAANGSSGAG